MMPKAYRLNSEAMAIIMESFASNLADQYGDGTTRDNYSYPPNGSQSRDSSNSGHELSPGGVYGSYGSTSGLVGREEVDPHYAGANGYHDRGRDKRR